MERLWNGGRFNFRSIFSQLLLYFLLLVLPIIILGIAMFSWDKNTIRNEIEVNARANVSFLRQTMESEVERIKELQYQMSNDQTLIRLINRYGNIPAYEYYPLISDVMRDLRMMEQSNSNIEDVSLYLPQMVKTISLVRGYIEMNQEAYAQELNQCRSTRSLVAWDSNGLYSAVIFPPYATIEEGNILYLFEVRMSNDRIRKFLAKYNQSAESNTALYSFSGKRWLFSSGNPLENFDGAKLTEIEDSQGKNLGINVKIDGKMYYVLSEYSAKLDSSFVQYIPIEVILRIPSRFEFFLWLYAFLSMIVFIIYSYMVFRLVKKPVNKIVDSFRALGNGDLNTKIKSGARIETSSEFSYLYHEFNRMMDYLNMLIDSNYKQRIYTQRAELKQLQLQIKPHFLFNTYFILHRMILNDDKENALALSYYMGTYFEYITRNMSDDVTLETEAEHAKSYAIIQQMRFGGKIDLEFGSIPDDYSSFMVPKMILQPILENAIEHGINKTTKCGKMKVEFSTSEELLSITVDDSGESITDEKIEQLQQKLKSADQNMEITGIINVHRRLGLKYGEKSGITVSRSELGGLKVLISIWPGRKSAPDN
jgi:two-component system sensor histidine kinase YesM